MNRRFRLLLPMLALVLAAQGGSPDTTILNPPAMTGNPGATRPDLRTPPYLPAPAPLPPPGIAAPPPPAVAPPAAALLPNSGPITGYGTGGMQQLPGSPPNPTYPAGGLMH